MHKFLRTIGFSDIQKKDLQLILQKIPKEMNLQSCPVLLLLISELLFGETIEKMIPLRWIIIIRMYLEQV